MNNFDEPQRTLTDEEWQEGMGCSEHRVLRSGSCHDCAMLQPEPPARYYLGAAPTQCDFGHSCRGNGKIESEFIDGVTDLGPWANMCPRCHQAFGIGVGTGIGQRYRKQEDGRWLKVEG